MIWVLIASGPSLTAADAEYCRGRAKVMVVNSSWQMAPWADALYAYDAHWWNYYQGVPQFHGEKWTSMPFPDDPKIGKDCEEKEKAIAKWNLRWIRGLRKPDISEDKSFIHFGGNSGFQAMNLAIHQGASKIVLLGYDMQDSDGKSHHHGDHPKEVARPSCYRVFIAAMESTVDTLRGKGIAVINCSRETALKCFPRADLRESLCNSSAGYSEGMDSTALGLSPMAVITSGR